jgi:hypothetical protein
VASMLVDQLLVLSEQWCKAKLVDRSALLGV